MNATGPYWWEVNIGSGNGLVPSGITWTSVDQDLQRHMVSLLVGPNELNLIRWKTQFILRPKQTGHHSGGIFQMHSLHWRALYFDSKFTEVLSCDLAALKTLLSVRPSVCHTFSTKFLSSHHHDFFRSYYHWQKSCPFKRSRSKVKVTEVKGNFAPIWAFPECNSSLNVQMATKWCTKLEVAKKRCPIVFREHLSNFKVTQDKKLSLLTQIGCFQTVTPVWIGWPDNGLKL